MTKQKLKVLFVVIPLLILIIASTIVVALGTNKTFFKEEYEGVDGKIRFIPKYSYFKSECCMTAAIFYSLRSESALKEEIENYMKDFKYFDDESTYGYMKDDVFIQEYEVVNHGMYRTIHITY
ncbi:MAG: hypothetical protein IKL68_04370 [Clostridia bacterium]|nr:hypothetical protein [Clostridia bacterium]